MAHALIFSGAGGAFAADLSWQHEENLLKAQSLHKLARQLGPNVRWGVAFKNAHGTSQSALCEPIAGVKLSWARPLATIVATVRPQPWVGLYHLGGEHYWYIVIRQGQTVIAGGDQVGTLNELVAIHAYHQSLPGWTEIEGNLDGLTNLARQATSVPALHDVQSGSQRAAALAIAATVLAVGTVFGGWHLYDQQQETERLAAQARQKAVTARKAAAAAQ